MNMALRHSRLAVAVLCVATFGFLIVPAGAAGRGRGVAVSGAIRACANKRTGVISLNRTKKRCKRNQRSVVWSLKGPGGAPGPAGTPGAAGAAGADGPPGVLGPTGPAGGPTGPTGPQGVQGTTGPAGAVGPTGASGAIGPTGAAGARGATGPSG